MQCPRCEAPLAAATAVCVQCGTRLPSEMVRELGAANRTLSGMRALAAQSRSAPPTDARPTASANDPLNTTVVVDAASVFTSELAFDCRPNMVNTLLGMRSSPLDTSAPSSAPLTRDALPGGEAAPPDSPRLSARRPAHPTQPVTTLHSGTPALNLNTAPLTPGLALPSLSKQTMLGIAHPGIAPLRSRLAAPEINESVPVPGSAAAESRHHQATALAADAEQAPPDSQSPPSNRSWVSQVSPTPVKAGPARGSLRAEGVHRLASAPALLRHATRMRRGAWLLLISGLGLTFALSVFALLWRTPEPLKGRLLLQEDGTPLVEVRCADCPQGTQVRLAGNGAELHPLVDHAAQLATATDLHAGVNRFAVEIDRPGLWRDEITPLELPVRFLVRGDTTGIASDHPELGITVHADPHAKVSVDTQPLSLDQRGYGRYAIALGERCQGPAEEPVTVAERIPYTIVDSDGTSHTGMAAVGATVLPLAIDSPGTNLATDQSRVLLVGRTVKEATVIINGGVIAVDSDGRFRHQVELIRLGEQTLEVRARAAGLASRTATLRITRVRDLSAYAAVYRESASQTYRELVQAGPNLHGLPVALDGSVADARVEPHATVFLLDVREGCDGPPCLVRVVYRNELEVRMLERLGVFGTLEATRDSSSRSTLIPEVSASFILRL